MVKDANEAKIEAAMKQNGHFLLLPPEVRVQIYRELLVDPYSRNGLTHNELAILQVNKKIYNEATLTFYQENKFEIWHPRDLKWLYNIGHRNRQKLRHVILEFPDCESYRHIHDWGWTAIDILFLLLSACRQLSLTFHFAAQHLQLLKERGVLRRLHGKVHKVTVASMADTCVYHERLRLGGELMVEGECRRMSALAKGEYDGMIWELTRYFTRGSRGKVGRGFVVHFKNTRCCKYDSLL